MSGTVDARDSLAENTIERVWEVLNRETPVETLHELYKGLRSERRPVLENSQPVAIGFDTNALFRLGLGKPGADALDYLQSLHKGPIIVPGQAVQEIWNNQLAGLQPKAKTLRQQFESLVREAEGIGLELGAAGVTVKEGISRLEEEHGEWVDPKTVDTLDGTLSTLLAIGRLHYAPRDRFAPLARIRKETKTPPGFKDAGHGDFFIWADFLCGLAECPPDEFVGTVLVTNDEKTDWSRNQVAHPILVAEVSALTGKPFWLWSLDAFRRYVVAVA